MKKGITVTTGYDFSGTWYLKIVKEKGRLTLPEIKAAVREAADWDYYLLAVDCFHDENETEQNGEVPEGDIAILYSAHELEGETHGT